MSQPMIQRTLEIGPIHLWLPSAMKLTLQLHGDQIVSSQTEFGYLSKAIEKKMVGENIEVASRFISRIEPESAFLLDRLYCEAIEESAGIEISERANWIRDIATQLSELNGLLKYLAIMAHGLGLSVLNHILLKHREELLDLVELLSGSRFGYYYLVPGGARYDVTDGFLERLDHWAETFQADQKKIEAMYGWTLSFQNRLNALGTVIDRGTFGFVSVAAIEGTRMGNVSHVESRLRYAFKKCQEITTEMRESSHERAPGNFKEDFNFESVELKKLSLSTELETCRGTWRLKLELAKNRKIKSVEISTPSDEIQAAIPLALEEESIEDVFIILQSLNFLVTEIDR